MPPISRRLTQLKRREIILPSTARKEPEMSANRSAKGNPASKRMMNPNNTRKRAANKARNDRDRAAHKKCSSSHQKDREVLTGTRASGKMATIKGIPCPTQPTKPRAHKTKKTVSKGEFSLYMMGVQKRILGDEY